MNETLFLLEDISMDVMNQKKLIEKHKKLYKN